MADCRYASETRNFSIFKTPAVRHLGILKLNFLTAIHFRDTFSVIMLNFVEIGLTVTGIAIFRVFLVKC